MPTPDELRDIAAEWLPSHTKRSDDVLAAADAWEMDRTFLRQTGERLEAAEKAIRLVANDISDRTHGAMASECQEWRQALLAALAGEEVPCFVHAWAPGYVYNGAVKRWICTVCGAQTKEMP